MNKYELVSNSQSSSDSEKPMSKFPTSNVVDVVDWLPAAGCSAGGTTCEVTAHESETGDEWILGISPEFYANAVLRKVLIVQISAYKLVFPGEGALPCAKIYVHRLYTGLALCIVKWGILAQG